MAVGQEIMTAQRGERPGFTGELWRAIEPIYAEIVRMPFLRGLIDGTLPMDAFRFYIIQDALYLRDYARCLSLASARASRGDVSAMFADHVLGIMAAEGSLHDTFFADFGITRAEVERLDTIIRQFLRALRPTQPVMRTEQVTDVLRETLALLKTEFENRRITVSVDITDTIPTVQLDRSQIKQVFFNLIKKQKIRGIFSSPPYIGQIDYHEQHAYAYDLF